MARTHAAKDARDSNRRSPLTFKVLMGLCMALIQPTMQEAKMTADGWMAGIRRRVRAHGFGADTGGTSEVVTGLIELLIGFIVLVICILLAFLLLPLVNNASNTLKNSANTTAEQKSILPIIGLTLIVAIVVMALAFMFAGFRQVIHGIRGS